MLIPSLNSTGNDIDIYLQPLINELQDVWHVEIETSKTFPQQSFNMHVGLMGMASDFPTYSMLSGWKPKGKWACPCCNNDTCSNYLKYSRKTCYMGNHRFLDINHPWRFNEIPFNESRKDRCSPGILFDTNAFK